MSGLELLTRLASTRPRLPVIVLTGHGDQAARRRCLEAGAVAFLETPFPSDAPVEAIRRWPGRDSEAP